MVNPCPSWRSHSRMVTLLSYPNLTFSKRTGGGTMTYRIRAVHRCFKALQSTTQPPFGGKKTHNSSPLQIAQSTKHAKDAMPSITLVDFLHLPHIDSKYQAPSRTEQKDLTDSILQEDGQLESWDTQLMPWTNPASFIVSKVWSFVFSLGASSFVLQGKTIHFSRHHITRNAKKLVLSCLRSYFWLLTRKRGLWDNSPVRIKVCED